MQLEPRRIPMENLKRTLTIVLLIGTTACLRSALAQDLADNFFKGRTVTIVIGLSPGGGNDLYARILGRHLVRHLPGTPSFVASNMPGAGGMVAANYLFNVAPKDGTVLAAPQRGVPFEPLTMGRESKAKFDPLKFNWIGSTNSDRIIEVAWHTTGIKTYSDLYDKELIVAGSGVGTESVVLPYLIGNIAGFKFRVIAGYPGSPEMDLAMERGEVGGRTISWTAFKSARMDWLTQGKVSILYQVAPEKIPELPDVPLATTFAKNDLDRQALELETMAFAFGRPYAAPPDTPKPRVSQLRTAFETAVNDSGFKSEVEKAGLDLSPITGERMEDILRQAYAAPNDVVQRMVQAGKYQPGLRVLDGRTNDR
jgi:tripartite-type tricarboxylate transporter receptor subunit TctC